MSTQACISLANVSMDGVETQPREFHVTKGLGLSWMSLPAPRFAGSPAARVRTSAKRTSHPSAIVYTTRPGSWIRLG
jgi:hypothetical protein